MKQEKLSVLFFAAKRKVNKKGEAPIFLRITFNKQRIETRIKRTIDPAHWDQKKECSTKRSREHIELNGYLSELKSRINIIYKQLVFDNVEVTADLICERLFNLNTLKYTLLSLFAEFNKKCRELIGIDYVQDTVVRYERTAAYFGEMLSTYHKVSDLALHEITQEHIRDFERFLKLKKKCSHNTSVKYLKCLKTIILRARANGLLQKNPYAEIKFRMEKTKLRYLTKKELEAVMSADLPDERFQMVRDLFVFCCFTGLAYIDAYELRQEHIVMDDEGNLWIQKTREKLDNDYSSLSRVPLLDIPRDILEKYKNHPLSKVRGTLLPFYSNQRMNSCLKQIGLMSGIKKNLTTHTARHTFATTVMLSNKVTLKNVSAMLGHSSIRETERYAKVLNEGIMKDVENVRDKFRYGK